MWCSLWPSLAATEMARWTHQDIMAKEFVPKVIMVAVWGPLLEKQRITLQCDNLSLVNSINKGTARQALVMHLLRNLWYFTAYYDIALTATGHHQHIS